MSLSLIGLTAGLSGASDSILKQKAYQDELARRKEQLNYDRNRQATIDQQNADAHEQNKKFNDYKIQNIGMGLKDAQRVQGLNDNIAQYNNYKSLGDKDSALRLYTDTANRLNEDNPNWDQNNIIGYEIDPESNTASMWLKNNETGQNIKLLNDNVSIDDLIQTTYRNIDPAGSYAGEQQAKAASLAAQAKRNQDIDDRNFDYNKDVTLAKIRGNTALELMGLRGKYQLERDYYDYQYGLGLENNRNGRLSYKGTGNSGGSKANNTQLTPFDLTGVSPQQMLPFIIGQESGGNHYGRNGELLTSSAGARGVTQVMPRTGANPGYGVKPLQNNSREEYLRFGGDLYGAYLEEFGGNHEMALAAYNAGPGRVQQAIKKARAANTNNWLQFTPEETQKYVPSILNKYAKAQKDGYIKTQGKVATDSIHAVSDRVAKELGDTPIALIKGGFSATKNHISKLLSKNSSTDDRKTALNSIYAQVKNTIKNTPAGQSMTEQQIHDYSLETTYNLIGTDSASIGIWINAPEKEKIAAAEAKKPKPTLGNNDIDNIILASGKTTNTNESQSKTPLVLRPEYMNSASIKTEQKKPLSFLPQQGQPKVLGLNDLFFK